MKISISDTFQVNVVMNDVATNNQLISNSMMDMDGLGGMEDPNSNSNSSGGMDNLLANWGFVGGVTGGVLALSILIGILLAKKRIKKGIDPYEN